MSHEAVILDGSEGEGGGQVLRTGLAMSAVSGKPVNIINIRAKRMNPGMARQHLAGLHLIREICEAEVTGDHIGSDEVGFKPGIIRHGDYRMDVGTAGSVTLVLQTVLPALASVKGNSIITITGGTDVKWAPPVDYCSKVIFPIMKNMGVDCKITVRSRGYYPKGGGEIVADIISRGCLEPLMLENSSGPYKVEGVVNISSLPISIAERVRDSALKVMDDGLKDRTTLNINHQADGKSQGVGIVMLATGSGAVLGSDSLGERGKKAETVGAEAAERLLADIHAGVGADLHASDQLLPFLAMAGGSYTARKLTGHAITNARTIGKFLENEISIDEDNMVRFSVK